MNRKIVLLALSCFVVSAYAADQQVYKWTDAAGVVHFSDSPPPADAKDAQLMRVSSGDRPHSVDATASNTAPANSTAPADNNAAGANAANASDINAKACANAHNNLDALNSKIQVSMTGPDGKQKVLDDKERQAQIAYANAQITLYCK